MTDLVKARAKRKSPMEMIKGVVLAFMVMGLVTCALAPGKVTEGTTHTVLTAEDIDCP